MEERILVIEVFGRLLKSLTSWVGAVWPLVKCANGHICLANLILDELQTLITTKFTCQTCLLALMMVLWFGNQWGSGIHHKNASISSMLPFHLLIISIGGSLSADGLSTLGDTVDGRSTSLTKVWRLLMLVLLYLLKHWIVVEEVAVAASALSATFLIGQGTDHWPRHDLVTGCIEKLRIRS